MTSRKSSKKFYKDEAFLKLIGQRMQELMLKKGITHEIFYNDTEINPHRHIVGRHNMTLSTFKRICDYLEVSPDEFMKGLAK